MYFVLDRGPRPGRWIDNPQGDLPQMRWSAWRSGSRLAAPPPDPLLFTLKRISPNASDHGPELPSFLNAAIPLFKRSLLAALAACGVDNIDAYNVDLRDPETDSVIRDYRAVNLIGMIAAADMAKSDATVHPGGPALIDVTFDKLVVDTSRTRQVKMFRLAEATKTILVHQSVKDHLEASGFDDLVFYRPENVAI